MWNCRACSSSPFKTIFGGGGNDGASVARSKGKRAKSEASKTESSAEYTSEGSYTGGASSYTETWTKPSAEELRIKCNAWESFVHPRAKEFWTNSEALQQVLGAIANSVDKDDDPVLADDSDPVEMTRCVFWHGEVASDGYPIIRVRKPGEAEQTATYVTRALVFLYADHNAYEELRGREPKAPFSMACNRPMCVKICHIGLDD